MAFKRRPKTPLESAIVKVRETKLQRNSTHTMSDSIPKILTETQQYSKRRPEVEGFHILSCCVTDCQPAVL